MDDEVGNRRGSKGTVGTGADTDLFRSVLSSDTTNLAHRLPQQSGVSRPGHAAWTAAGKAGPSGGQYEGSAKVEERQRFTRGVVVALSGFAVLAGIWLGMRSPDAVPMVLESDASEVDPTEANAAPAKPGALVHVSGAVVAPGLVILDEGDRIADAIAGAGGVLAYADLSAINLAGPVSDGQQIIVPGPGIGSDSVRSVAEPDDGLVHLNTATAEELERLPGIGEVLAKRIVARREASGPFQAVEDLLDVSGIGEGKLAGLRDLAAVP